MLAQMQQDIESLKRKVSKLENIKIVGFNRQESARGVSFSGGEPEKGNIGRPKTVVIVKKPVAGDAELTVREAKYANWPPEPCEGTEPNKICHYTWHGDDFRL